ncbi:Mannose-6-phosphate isomerase like protein [Argiope bruennichi]|uniref:mannose-6-phosphate isomerase n=1 Tax=Argiope bruennichi TaxID=94029 RepID=A0A8T0EXQ1_ARGBR|nr:Mannose-6-phosphate isomerase like protein [Argiope bruennichi]
MMAQVFKIQAAIKNYDWGKVGMQSVVAQLQKEGCNNFLVDEKTPYAEMWIGTHDSGPALIPTLKNIKLKEWLLENPQCLGDNIRKAFSHITGLPFLFKVLSVNKALSIQAHPNKKTAEKLHQMYPDKYPDDNHKPEMAIALTNFEALCGFRPLCEIQTFFVEIPELQKIVDSKIVEMFLNSKNNDALKPLFTAIMTCSPKTFQPILLQILEYFKQKQFENPLCESIHDLFLRTYDQYPGDIGCFCLFFLNYLKLKPGEAIFLAANVPHAYLSGDCIECMACSDNVVRAGLTPKFRDVNTLCDILMYDCNKSEENKFLPICDPGDPHVKIFDPPVPEFVVDSIELKKQETSYILKILQTASVLLVVKGKGSYKYENEEGDLMPGSILFISSGCQVFLNPAVEFLMFRAYCNA